MEVNGTEKVLELTTNPSDTTEQFYQGDFYFENFKIFYSNCGRKYYPQDDIDFTLDQFFIQES